MKKLLLIILPAALLAAGCASKFVEPVSGPMAKIRIKPAGPVTYTWVHTYEKPDCKGPQWMGSIGDPDKLFPAHNPKGMIGSTAEPHPNILELSIPAQQTTLLFTQHGPHSGGYIRNCKLAVSFLAEVGKEYEVGYGYDSTQCFASVDVLQLIDGRATRKPVPDAKKHMGECLVSKF